MQEYGLRANSAEGARAIRPCLVCDDSCPRYAWTDLNGEGYCLRCGTPYQLMNGKLADGETYPRINVRADAVPMFRRYFVETGKPWGGGCFVIPRDYPECLRAREAFNAWFETHKDEYPELQREPEPA